MSHPFSDFYGSKTRFFSTKLAVGFLLLAFLFSSCKEEKPFAFSEDDFVFSKVVIDIYTVEAAIRDYRDAQTKDSLKKVYFEQIYQIHDVDSEWMSNQRTRLEADPLRMDSVYTRAIFELDQLKSSERRK